MNLFLSTRRMAEGHHEDHLTEFFAAALHIFPQIRKGFYDLALESYCRASGWGPCEISSIETQPCYDDSFCQPDMLITLSNGKHIACEHKLDAVETMGPDADKRPQLERYLDLPEIDGLLYVRASWKPPERHVVNHPKYIKPRDGEHFLWRDFHPLFASSTDPFLLWMREGFERFGFTPPHPQVTVETEADRHNFAKLWSKTRSYAHRLGWSTSPGSIIQLYLDGNENSSAEAIFIQPTARGFQFRATPKLEQQEHCFAALASACNATPAITEHGVKVVRRTTGKEAVYDIWAPSTAVLGVGELPATETENRLHQFVAPLLDAVQLRP